MFTYTKHEVSTQHYDKILPKNIEILKILLYVILIKKRRGKNRFWVFNHICFIFEHISDNFYVD